LTQLGIFMLGRIFFHTAPLQTRVFATSRSRQVAVMEPHAEDRAKKSALPPPRYPVDE
jgi:hypothetical protein